MCLQMSQLKKKSHEINGKVLKDGKIKKISQSLFYFFYCVSFYFQLKLGSLSHPL